MKFELNEDQLRVASIFYSTCFEIMKYKNKEASAKDQTYKYIFSHDDNGVGNTCAVECNELDIGIDLTDYGSR